jgi:hypothetical protein
MPLVDFTQPPFVAAPGSTFLGNPVPQKDQWYFCPYNKAVAIKNLITQAIAKVGGENLSLVIKDAIASGVATQFNIVPDPSGANKITIWVILGSFTIGKVTYPISEWVGGLVFRKRFPNELDDKPAGIGGPNLYIQISSVGPVAQAYWNV